MNAPKRMHRNECTLRGGTLDVLVDEAAEVAAREAAAAEAAALKAARRSGRRPTGL